MGLIPHCGVHVSVAMVFVPATLTVRHLRRKGPTINDADLSFDLRSRTGLWRCPVAGCARCAAPEAVTQERKPCPQCGAPPDRSARGWRATRLYDYRCKHCYNAAAQRTKRRGEELRKKRKLRYALIGT